MAGKFTSVWGAVKPATPVRAPRSNVARQRQGVAGGDTDAESGAEADSLARSLRALDVMRQRGLIPEEEYREHRAAIIAREGRGDGETEGD